jgi:hypothetical protein
MTNDEPSGFIDDQTREMISGDPSIQIARVSEDIFIVTTRFEKMGTAS